MTGIDWPDVPTNRTTPCDLCFNTAKPGSALCGRCADEHLRTEKEQP